MKRFLLSTLVITSLIVSPLLFACGQTKTSSNVSFTNGNTSSAMLLAVAQPKKAPTKQGKLRG